MSTFMNTGRSPDERLALATAGEQPSARLRRRLSLVVSVLVLGWAAVELVGLSVNHTIGPELYGVLVAALAVAAGGLTTLLLSSPAPRPWITVLVIVLWAVVAVGGLAGAIAHVVGPGVGHGPIDPRERPAGAPLIFTALGLVGGGALVYARRMGIRRMLELWKG